MKIIALTGAKNSRKDVVARRLATNSDVVYVRPYTDRDVPVNAEDWELDDYTHMNEKQLSYKMERDEVLSVAHVGNHRYVFFMSQFNADFCVLILDDVGIFNLKKNWKGEIVTVKVHSDIEEPSDRCLMKDEEFDFVFNIDHDDFDDLEDRISWQGNYSG